MKINFTYGQVLGFDDLPENSIALDGAVQGPQLDPENRRFSFDHHANSVRLVTLATCQQVATALRLGLVVDDGTQVFINDLDADTVLSVWILQNPDRINEETVKVLIESVGFTDAHGPVWKPIPFYYEISPRKGSLQSIELLFDLLKKVDEYIDGKWQPKSEIPKRYNNGFGWSPETGWQPVEGVSDFGQMYSQGFIAGFMHNDASNGTKVFTFGKRSDLVPFPLKSLIEALAQEELQVNPDQDAKTNWGGSTTVGGSPRNANGEASRLSVEQVLEVCKKFA